MNRLLVLVGFACGAVTLAQQNPAALAARSWRETHERAILTEFMDLLAMPNLARDEVAVRKNANAIVGMLEKRGVKARLLPFADSLQSLDWVETANPPILYGCADSQAPRPPRTPARLS